MPIMDGMEATQIIRSENPHVMIVAVSAVEDVQKREEILRIGAQDCISKPVNSVIFLSRLKNYLTLIENRVHQSFSSKAINLYCRQIYKRHIRFMLIDEEALSEFWEYYMLEEDHSALMCDVVATLFSLGDYTLRASNEASIIIENDEQYRYMTFVSKEAMASDVIKTIVTKSCETVEYLFDAHRVSFKVPILAQTSLNHDASNNQVLDEPSKASVNNTLQLQENENADVVNVIQSMDESEYLVFDIIDSEDLAELQSQNDALASLLLLVGAGNISFDELDRIIQYLRSMSKVLSLYSECYDIAASLAFLADELFSHQEKFIERSKELSDLCAAFSHDYSQWMQMSFETGAPSIDFMNATIKANAETIAMMLKDEEQSSEALDDIFDF